MVRIVLFVLLLAAAAFGLSWLADRPGEIAVTWQGYRIETSLLVGLAGLLVLVAALMIAWTIVRFVFRIPAMMSITARARRLNKGYAAVSRGMIAAAVGDARTTERAAREAAKQLGQVPLAALLQAQAAQIAGDRERAVRAFSDMLDDPETRILGLRGLYLEARRADDAASAFRYAQEAYGAEPLPWAGQALLEHHARAGDWSAALGVVESSISRKAVDKAVGNRQRGVLKTAIAMDIAEQDPDESLRLAKEAIKLAPGLVPAYAAAGRALARRGDIRRGARILEDGWRIMPHPDLARAYLELRPGDSARDRLARAQTLVRIHSTHVESRLLLARAALEARDFTLARATIAPLLATDAPRPSVRVCLLMADIEETEHGVGGRVREWLARAARAPRDPMWIADGIASDVWAPASPVTGKLDAFVWEPPVERLQAPAEPVRDEIIAPVIPPPASHSPEQAAPEPAAAKPTPAKPIPAKPIPATPTSAETPSAEPAAPDDAAVRKAAAGNSAAKDAAVKDPAVKNPVERDDTARDVKAKDVKTGTHAPVTVSATAADADRDDEPASDRGGADKSGANVRPSEQTRPEAGGKPAQAPATPVPVTPASAKSAPSAGAEPAKEDIPGPPDDPGPRRPER